MIKAGSCIRCIVAAGLSVITITAFGLQIVKADSRGATYAGDTKFVYELDLRMNGATASIDAEDNCDMSLDGSVTYFVVENWTIMSIFQMRHLIVHI